MPDDRVPAPNVAATDEPGHDYSDPYDYPELPIEKRLFLAAHPDLGPDFLYGWGEGDGAYDTIRGLLARESWLGDVAVANTMGLVGNWDVDDVNEAVTNALHEYRDLRAAAVPAATPADDRCPSCEHRREFHSEPGCWYSVTVGTVGKSVGCNCGLVDWPAPAVPEATGEPSNCGAGHDPARISCEAATEINRLRAELARLRPVVDAAEAYYCSTSEPTDTPHEDALLDAVSDYRIALDRDAVAAYRAALDAGTPTTETEA